MAHVERKRRWMGPGLHLAALLSCCLGLPSHSEPAPSQTEAPPKRETGAYGRLGAGVAWPETDAFRDGNCTSTQPAALFGCGAGNDGRRLGATGGFNPNRTLGSVQQGGGFQGFGGPMAYGMSG